MKQSPSGESVVVHLMCVVPHALWNLKVKYGLQDNAPLFDILSQVSQVRYQQNYFFNTHSCFIHLHNSIFIMFSFLQESRLKFFKHFSLSEKYAVRMNSFSWEILHYSILNSHKYLKFLCTHFGHLVVVTVINISYTE